MKTQNELRNINISDNEVKSEVRNIGTSNNEARFKPGYETVIAEDKYVRGVEINYTENKKDGWNWMQLELGGQLVDIWKKNGSNLEWNKSYSKLPKFEAIDSLIINGEVFTPKDVNSDNIKSCYAGKKLKEASDLYHIYRTIIWTDARNEYFRYIDGMSNGHNGLNEVIARAPEYEMDTLKHRIKIKDMTPKIGKAKNQYEKKNENIVRAEKAINNADQMFESIKNDSLYADSDVQVVYGLLDQARYFLTTKDSVINQKLENYLGRMDEMLDEQSSNK